MKTVIELISSKIKNAFEDCGYESKYGQTVVSNRPDLCQYQCNGALAAAKQYHKAPIMIAGEIAAKLADDPFFSKFEAVTPGFLNIDVADTGFASYLQEMLHSDKFGFEPAHSGETVVIDYGGANVAKPLHVGHLRPAVIGESIKRICAYDGYKAIGDVHLGDWGLQIGLIITELKARKPELPYFDDSFTGEYPKEAPFTISELEEIYPYASAYSKEHEEYRDAAKEATNLLQNGHRGYRAIWQHIIDISIEDLKKNYDKLNVSFELWKKESDAQPYIPQMVEDLKSKGVAHISEGALVVDVKEDTDTKEMPPCIILKSDGSTLYASTDIATIIEREKLFKPDRIIYVVDKRQALHFEQVFRTVRKADFVHPEIRLDFVGNGTMNGPDGKPFKTRDGGVMRLEYLIKDINDKVLEKMADRDMDQDEALRISRIVGLAALKYGDLSNQATKDYVFDIDRFTAFEGNTGPYILYTMVRIKSILDKYCSACALDKDELFRHIDNGTLNIYMNNASTAYSDSERGLMMGVTAFADAVRHASDELAPHKICSYIYELADLFNTFYHENKIIGEENTELRDRWIALSVLVLKVLGACTDLIAVEVPDRM